MKYKKPEMKTPCFKALSEKELKEINGGNVGSCVGLGYTCNTYKGGFKGGICLIVGYSCSEKGGI